MLDLVSKTPLLVVQPTYPPMLAGRQFLVAS
jgi:hypothetical protein